MFLLLGGYLPFDSHGSNDTKQVFERTRNGQYYFYPQRWQGISHAAKDLIANCLTVNPNKRISSQMALAHGWMGEGLALPKTIISAQSLASTYYDTMKHKKGEAHRQGGAVKDKADRLQELNDDFTVYMEERAGDSIVSAMTGAGRGFGGGGGGVAPSPTISQFYEDSLSGKPFSDFYTKETQLGQGGFAKVFRCRHQRSGFSYAVKAIDSSNASKAQAAILRDEITVLKYLRGAPFIIRLYDVFQEANMTYLVLEEMKGGDLLHRIVDKEVYTEREARQLCKILFSAVNFCHMRQIAHRDIKLENLLLQEENNDATIKLADFGFAKKVKRANGLKTMLGTPSFMAPEIYDLRKEGYDQRCDLWSVGVVVFCLLGGYLPFEGSNVKEISILVMRGEFVFHDEYWRDVSPSAKKLISALMQVDPSHRLSAQQALCSRWMTMEDAELSVIDLSLTKSRMERMITGKEKFKNAVRAVSRNMEIFTSYRFKLVRIPHTVELLRWIR
jgi:calcium/calmodulin-dependent protein kinase I